MIPFVDLKTQYLSIREEILEAVTRTLDNAQFILGREVAAFEEKFAAYCGCSEAIGVNSGTSALHLALLAAGVGPGDEVITTPFTFIATVSAIDYTGATPRLVDVERSYFTMDVTQLEAAITPRTKAIVPVHLFGHPADMDPILSLARKHNLVVIEDAAQAHGAGYKGRTCGSLGDMGCFSFYPTKNLGAYGEGGAVTTSNGEYARRVRLLRDWGAEEKYLHTMKGFNYRMEGVQGAILGVKLRYLEAWTQARRALAALYEELLAGSGILTPREAGGARHVYHIYAVRGARRELWRQRLKEAGIESRVYYPVPVHLQPCFAGLGYQPGDFPVSEEFARTQLSLPMYPDLKPEQLRKVAGELRRIEAA